MQQFYKWAHAVLNFSAKLPKPDLLPSGVVAQPVIRIGSLRFDSRRIVKILFTSCGPHFPERAVLSGDVMVSLKHLELQYAQS